MWLNALSKRTPRAYFIYAVIALIITILPSTKSFLAIRSVDVLSDFIAQQNFFFIPAICILLSLLLNRVFLVSDTFSRNTLWPGYIYLLVTVGIINQVSVLDVLLHGIAGVLILREIFTMQFNQLSIKECFNIGLLLGLAFCFHSHVIHDCDFSHHCIYIKYITFMMRRQLSVVLCDIKSHPE